MISFRCAECGEEFDAPDGDEELARAEALELWGKEPGEPGMVQVCDECWREMFSPFPKMKAQ